MRIVRIYHHEPLIENQSVLLSDDAHHHLTRVLRMQVGAQIQLFHQPNQQALASLVTVNKKQTWAFVNNIEYDSVASPLQLHLGQVISRGEKMEFTIQKAVELGVNKITPLISERCGVKLSAERFEKKLVQWQNIAIAACEQCGRNDLPQIEPLQLLNLWCQQIAQENEQRLAPYYCLNLHPTAPQGIKSLPDQINKICLLIGPEGGLTDQEINSAQHYHFNSIKLGPRILRTETAAMVTITALQVRFGDLG